jgi:hypothetical protein
MGPDVTWWNKDPYQGRVSARYILVFDTALQPDCLIYSLAIAGGAAPPVQQL